MRGVSAPALLAAAALQLGCEAPEVAGSALLVPSRGHFPAVAGALERRCATLDCHGRPERNLRLYSGIGLRLASSDVSGSGSTTEAEHDASYESVVGLEPEALSVVVSEGGEAPDRLTLVRKARGAEAHKGGARITPGDDADRCVTSWLASAVDEAACARAAEVGPPR